MPRTRPRKYQKVAVRKIEQKFQGRALLADEMGLGKTFQSLLVLKRNKRYMLPAVVICPATLKWNWQAEAAHHIGMSAEVLEGRTPPSYHQWRSHNLLIINYEILGSWMDYLLGIDPQLIIMDEVHRIKSRTAQCTEHCRLLCRYCPHILALSGTPLTNTPADLYTTLNILWPERFNSFRSFAMRYTNPELKPWGWVYKGGKNLPELHRILKQQGMIRRKKADYLHELPDKQVTVLPQPLTRPKMREYQKAEKHFIEWLSKKSKRLAARARKAQRIVQMGYLRRLAAELKMADVRNWIDSYIEQTDAKLIVFGVHHDILQPLHKRYKASSILINGKVTGKKRHNRVLEFRKKASKQIAFMNIKAGGVGLNMPEASNVLFIELPWTPAEVDQGISRAHRMGQTNSVDVRIMIAKGTIEEKLCRVIQEKQGIADAVIDGGVSVSQDMNIFDTLEREILKGPRK